MTPSPHASPRERVNQKQRTRSAILAAAVALAEEGLTPSVSDAADAAGVGRTTAYRYFQSQDHLLFAAMLDSVPSDIQDALGSAGASLDARDRVRAVINTLNRRVRAHEPAFRTLLRLSLDKAVAKPSNSDPRAVRLLGGFRARWLDEALEPLRERLPPQAYRRLLAALTLCVGVEPYVVMHDACGLGGDESDEVIEWIASTLLDAALTEASATDDAGGHDAAPVAGD